MDIFLVRKEPIFEWRMKSGGIFSKPASQNTKLLLIYEQFSVIPSTSASCSPHPWAVWLMLSLVWPSVQQADSYLQPLVWLCQLGTCYTHPKMGPSSAVGISRGWLGLAHAKVDFAVLPHWQCPAIGAARRSLLQARAEFFCLFWKKYKSFYHLRGYLRTYSFWTGKQLLGTVLLRGRHCQREVFMGLTSATVFVSQAPKGSGCFERKSKAKDTKS